jgi:hypothetical protein
MIVELSDSDTDECAGAQEKKKAGVHAKSEADDIDAKREAVKNVKEQRMVDASETDHAQGHDGASVSVASVASAASKLEPEEDNVDLSLHGLILAFRRLPRLSLATQIKNLQFYETPDAPPTVHIYAHGNRAVLRDSPFLTQPLRTTHQLHDSLELSAFLQHRKSLLFPSLPPQSLDWLYTPTHSISALSLGNIISTTRATRAHTRALAPASTVASPAEALQLHRLSAALRLPTMDVPVALPMPLFLRYKKVPTDRSKK